MAVKQSYDTIYNLQLIHHDNYQIVESPEEKYWLNDLPVKKLKDFQEHTTHCTHAIEVCRDVPISDDVLQDLMHAIVAGERLPPPICFKGAIPQSTVQYVFKLQSPGAPC